MEKQIIEQERAAIINSFGRWTAHNIQLKDDLYTIENKIVGDEIKLNRILQIIADNTNQPISELRILDLASHEGLYSLELAKHGARVVGIEARRAHIEKSEFAKRVIGLNNVEFHLDDVRNLSLEKYGEFDVVLCLGILYHLDAPDVFSFLERIAEVCRQFIIIDSLISLTPKKAFIYKGKKYWGKSYREHMPFTSLEQRAKHLWSSIDNAKSYWLTRLSLYNFLAETGFTSVYECHNPAEPGKQKDRITLLAKKGKIQTSIITPHANKMKSDKWPEKQSVFRKISDRINKFKKQIAVNNKL